MLLEALRPVPTRSRIIAAGLILTSLVLGAVIGSAPSAVVLMALAGLVALLAGLAILAEPALGLALTIMLAPFGPFERANLHVLPIDSGQIVLLTSFAAYALRGIYQRDHPRRVIDPAQWLKRWPLLLPLGCFLALGLVSFGAASSLSDWAAECLKWVEVIAVYLLVAAERSSHKRALLISALLCSAALQGGLGLYQYFRGFGPKEFLVVGTKYFRSYGTFEQPNPFGGYAGLIWPACAGIALMRGRQAWAMRQSATKKGVVQALWLGAFGAAIAAGLALSGVFTSGSRGARLGAGMAGAVMLLALTKHPGRWFAGILALLLLAWTTGLLPQGPIEQAQSFVAEYGNIDVRGVYLTPVNFSNIERLAHWQAAIGMATDHPFFGVGFGNYGAAYAGYRALYWANALGHAHNYYLNIFAETGVLGFIAYLAMWIAIAAHTWRTTRGHTAVRLLAAGALGAWAHLTAHHFVDNLYVANTYILIGLLLGLTTPATSQPSVRD